MLNIYNNEAIYVLNGTKETNWKNIRTLLSLLGYKAKEPDGRCAMDTFGIDKDGKEFNFYDDGHFYNKPNYKEYNCDCFDNNLPLVEIWQFDEPDSFDYNSNQLKGRCDASNGYHAIRIYIDNAHTINLSKLKAARNYDNSPLAPVIKEINKPYGFDEYKTDQDLRDLALTGTAMGNYGFLDNTNMAATLGFMMHVPMLKEFLEKARDEKVFDMSMLGTYGDTELFNEARNGDNVAKAFYLGLLVPCDNRGNYFGNYDDSGYEQFNVDVNKDIKLNDTAIHCDKILSDLDKHYTDNQLAVIKEGIKIAQAIDWDSCKVIYVSDVDEHKMNLKRIEECNKVSSTEEQHNVSSLF